MKQGEISKILPRMPDKLTNGKPLKALGIYSCVIMLGGLFISSMIQGLLVHLSGNGVGATVLYIAGLACLAGSIFTYTKGRGMLDTIA